MLAAPWFQGGSERPQVMLMQHRAAAGCPLDVPLLLPMHQKTANKLQAKSEVSLNSKKLIAKENWQMGLL